MTSYLELLAEHWRLSALRILSVAPGYRANDSVLHSAIERFGHVMTRDQLNTVLSWLAENQLITTEAIESVLIATLTKRGQDVAEGRATQPGVKRPGPR